MLDAFIIEKIRREEEQRRYERLPLRIERPSPPRRPSPDDKRDDDEQRDRGVVIIEFAQG